MAKADLINILYSKEKSPLEFHFEQLTAPPLYSFLTQQDLDALYYIASSTKLSSKIDDKYEMIKNILVPRNFKKFASGTNRIIYKHLENPNILLKVSLDKVGLRDNWDEYKNQFILKPFVSKTFEVSYNGAVALSERVLPITSKKEFASIAGDVFDLLNTYISGRYIMEDIGSNYFLNYGLRNGFGVVILDYSYLYELDGNKLYCNKLDPYTLQKCNGVIDYDVGFNNLICTKCGKRYLATELQKSIEDKTIILKDEGEISIKVRLCQDNKIIRTYNDIEETDTIIKRKK